MVLNWRGPCWLRDFAAVFAILLLMAHQNQFDYERYGIQLYARTLTVPSVVRMLCTARVSSEAQPG